MPNTIDIACQTGRPVTVRKVLNLGDDSGVEFIIENDSTTPVVVYLEEAMDGRLHECESSDEDSVQWQITDGERLQCNGIIDGKTRVVTVFEIEEQAADRQRLSLPRTLTLQTVELEDAGNGEEVDSDGYHDRYENGEADRETRQPDGSGQKNGRASWRPRPAIGIIATEQNVEHVSKCLVNAKRNGYEVLVTYSADLNRDAVQFVEQFGAHLVHPKDRDADNSDLRDILAEAAERRGLPGPIYYEPDGSAADAETEYTSDETSPSVGERDAESSPGAARTKTAAAIPAYNEAGSIGDVVTAAGRHVDEVIVVDDGSADETVEEASEAGATVIQHEFNLGYGGALKTSFRAARQRNVDWLVVLDADGQHDPEEIPILHNSFQSTGADVVIGSRFEEESEHNAPLYRQLGISVINLFTNLSMGAVRRDSWVSDTQSGFRAYSHRAIESLAQDDFLGEGMSASLDVLFHADRHGYSISEVGVTVKYDVENANSHNPVAHGLRLVNNVLRTIERKRPLTVLGVPGFALSFLGFGFGYWTLSNYVDTGGFPVGLAVTSIFFTLTGLLVSFTAIILHALNTHFHASASVNERPRDRFEQTTDPTLMNQLDDEARAGGGDGPF